MSWSILKPLPAESGAAFIRGVRDGMAAARYALTPFSIPLDLPDLPQEPADVRARAAVNRSIRTTLLRMMPHVS